MHHRSPEQSAQAVRQYDREELETFKQVVRGVVGSLCKKQSPLVHPDQLEVTIIRIAAAIFEVADSGVREPARMQSFAEARLDAVGYDADMPGSHPVRPTRH